MTLPAMIGFGIAAAKDFSPLCRVRIASLLTTFFRSSARAEQGDCPLPAMMGFGIAAAKDFSPLCRVRIASLLTTFFRSSARAVWVSAPPNPAKDQPPAAIHTETKSEAHR